ncbi:MAG: cation transporter, partial [Deltaproteobacteria bacterium]|nr:cation transporter [Deltaproteobacteria bacterium]
MTILGAVANAILVALKAAAGLAGGSSVLVADAVHSLSDLVTDILVLFGLRAAAKP